MLLYLTETYLSSKVQEKRSRYEEQKVNPKKIKLGLKRYMIYEKIQKTGRGFYSNEEYIYI